MLDLLIYINIHGFLHLSAGSGEVGDACTAGAAQLASKYFTIFIIQYYIYNQVVYVNNLPYYALLFLTILYILAYNFNCTRLIILKFPFLL